MINLNSFEKKFDVFLTEDTASIQLNGHPGVDSNFVECIERLGGKSFADGIYRVFSSSEIPGVTKQVEEVFREYEGKITVFACDWLGRYFAVDSRRTDSGFPEILMLETGAGEAMQIPVGIHIFHSEELVEYTEDALAANFFAQWKSISSEVIDLSSCVGYKIPLFLGGADTVENLELIDRAFYTDICGQLRRQTLELKDGQSIGQVKIE